MAAIHDAPKTMEPCTPLTVPAGTELWKPVTTEIITKLGISETILATMEMCILVTLLATMELYQPVTMYIYQAPDR